MTEGKNEKLKKRQNEDKNLNFHLHKKKAKKTNKGTDGCLLHNAIYPYQALY